MNSARQRLQKEISDHCFVTKDDRELFDSGGKPFKWFLDLKGILFKPGMLDTIASLFWDHLKTRGEFQLSGLETVAIALIGGIVIKAQQDGTLLNASYARKSRKRDGMQRNLEGSLTDDPVILVDDALNSGKSIVRQVEALKAEGKVVTEVCVMVAFRDPAYYEYFTKNNIRIWSIFTLEDFPQTGGLLKDELHITPPPSIPFKIEWKFSSEHPHYEMVLPKSAPTCDDERVYFGSDNGTMWALNQIDGSVAWSFKTLFGAGRKRIFSSPLLYKGTVYFGAYDGNVYALDAKTGTKRWVNLDADWVGSSPSIAPDLNMIFIGLEFGLWRKQGGIAAFDATTGEKRWWQVTASHVHSSPAYSKRFNSVVVGSRNGSVFAFNAKTGQKLWQFSESGDVKGGISIDEERGLVFFGSWDDRIYTLDIRSGTLIRTFESYKPIYSTPVVWNGKLYMGLLDKRIVCFDLQTGAQLWQYQTQSRVFATPMIIEGRLYCGSNDGRLYELDPETGREISFLQLTERIVNKVAYNPTTRRFFVPTYANEIYCVERTSDH